MHDDESTNDPMDAAMDDRLRAMASESYNAADGEVPREQMWSRISAARRAARVAPAVHADESHVAPASTPTIVPLRRGHPRAWRWSAVLAAGLILGVVVDRQLVRGRADVDRSVGMRVTTTPVAPSVAAQATPESTNTQRHTASALPATGATHTPRRDAAVVPIIDQPMHVAGTESRDNRAPAESLGATSPAPAVRDLYHAAAVQTLVQAEALLTAYRANGDAVRDPQAMQQAARWARDVLSSTRLLLDSPAARDPQMRALFTDLELVLAQIVQLSGAPLQASERELIERAMRERDLLPRLRTAVPAGLATS